LDKEDVAVGAGSVTWKVTGYVERMEGFRGIVIRDGPTRPPRRFGPWPGHLGAHGHAQEAARRVGRRRIAAIAELLGLTDAQVRAARYCGAFPDKIDQRIAFNTEDADEAEAAWQREQPALA
jgi:hypothetical protein